MCSYLNYRDPADDYRRLDPRYLARQCLKRLRGARCINFQWERNKFELFRNYGRLSYSDLRTSEAELDTLVRIHAYRNALRALAYIFRKNEWVKRGRWNEKVSDQQIAEGARKYSRPAQDFRKLLRDHELASLFFLSEFQWRVVRHIESLPDQN